MAADIKNYLKEKEKRQKKRISLFGRIQFFSDRNDAPSDF